MTVDDTERYLFLALLQAIEDIELLFHSMSHRHTALLTVLRNNELITPQQYEDAVRERQAAGAVDLAESRVGQKEAGPRRSEAGARARTLDVRPAAMSR